MKKNNFKKLFLLGVLFIFSFSLQAQSKQELNKIKEKYDQKKLTSLKNSFKEKSSTQKQYAIKIAKEKGWKIKFTTQDGRLLELQKIVNGKPIYYTTFNVAAAKSTRVDHLNAGGSLGLNLEGQNMTAHVWDGGIARASHQEYDGAGGNNRFSAGDSGSLNYHSAHVTGTIMASGVVANSKGMAPHSSVIGYDWNSDLSEATSAASNGMLISNHSYGYATRNALGQVQVPQYYFGGYIEDSRDWDEIMFNAPNYLMVVAAGNDGDDDTANTDPTGGYGFDKLTGHSTAKNNLVVAAANDASIDNNGNLLSATIANFSSEGPTDDFRIKPDIAGNGVSVYSTYDNSDTAYNSISGTSMASPNIAGSLVLLQQHYNNLNNSFMKAATLKGLALHTADDAGFSGPDAIFGWGLMNSKAAAEAITNKGNESKVDELTLTSGQTYSITVDSDGINPLLASISWTDRAGTANTGTVNLTTPVLVNDLDIRVTQGVTSHLPYELTGAVTNAKQDNNVDPYERVDVSGASGTYTVTVTNKGSLIGGSQNFSLIVTGLTGTPVICNATVPSNVIVSNLDTSTASISWDAVATASYDVRYRQTGTSAWITSAVSASNVSLTGLSSETSYEVQVRSKCSDGATSAYSNSLNFTTTEIQLNYCASNGNSVADEYISNVNLEGINNTTGASSSGYADYTSQSTNLTKGTSATITITPTWTGTIYNEGYAVFIDYNKDGDFDDSGETVWTKTASKTKPVSGSFTVPTSATTGATRMRVVMQYNTVPSACGAYNYGETEDYNVNLVTAVADTTAPTAPTNVSASAITQTTATLSWSASTDNVGVTGYEIFSNGTSIGTVTATSANITGLTANTSYSYSIKAKDAAENTSNSSDSVSFTTLANALVYCSSKGNRVTYEWIDYVSFGGMTNTTGANAGYGDFTSKTATVSRGSNNQLIISAGFAVSTYTEYWAVWIDFNQNGTFEESEKVTSGSSSSAANLTATISIPSSANTGQTRMRVSMKYNSAQTACETFSDGEVEDYTVNITNATANYTTFSNTTSGDELGNESKAFDFTVYPNPVEGNVLNIHLNDARDVNFAITNLLGQTLKSGVLTKQPIDVRPLRKGIYMLEITDGQKSVVKKFIKQ
jgi:hypothetical protein